VLLLTALLRGADVLQSLQAFVDRSLRQHISVGNVRQTLAVSRRPGTAAAVLNACRVDADQPKQQQLQQQLVVELAAANSRR
jgi:hypothetical protein